MSLVAALVAQERHKRGDEFGLEHGADILWEYRLRHTGPSRRGDGVAVNAGCLSLNGQRVGQTEQPEFGCIPASGHAPVVSASACRR